MTWLRHSRPSFLPKIKRAPLEGSSRRKRQKVRMRMRMLLPPWSDLRLLVLPLERQQPRFLSTSGSRSHPGPGKEEKEEEKEEVVISTPSRTLYQDLGLEGSNASSEEIKTAYYQLSKKYHPDLNPGDEEAAVNRHSYIAITRIYIWQLNDFLIYCMVRLSSNGSRKRTKFWGTPNLDEATIEERLKRLHPWETGASSSTG